ncbi:hypothetical protein B0A55_00925 [Friedmanniomyces simplex]|uniref:Urea active transporter n=1 Tax=Friedmanniomyces simplex TaxID=329884 RepID=A0A4U0Y1S9_9PEZI|nr:hypothetical protein B0A55_00925 [Friedmanniomyces simplex]
MASTDVAPILSQGVGYGVVIGIGAFFTIVMAGISWTQNRYTRFSTKTSEEFNTASRSVKPGLIACGVVSAWTWAATLLQSATVAYEYGISGPFWYAAGATFSVLAVKVKQNAPMCHTFLEIVYKRYGAATHCVFIFFALATNILVASQLLLGGSAVVTALTGMNVYAAVFLIPTGVCAYVVLGGLRATFLCDYSHTLIVMIVILYFMFNVYTSNELIGSPAAMWELLGRASELRPVAGNIDGSYLTLKSNGALIFGVIQLCSGMGTVFLDQGYWQRAIASRPKTAVPGYILGGFAWFAIPFGFATTLGLSAVALTDNPAYPTYPNEMTQSQVSSGLSAAFGAAALLGKSGSIALLITLFMAVTSSSSSELIAVSSILTFDVYKTYVKPTAAPNELIFVSHVMICFFGLVMAAFACIWNAVGVDLGWLFLVMGLIIGGAVFPAAFTLCWKGQTRIGAVAGCIGGLAAGVTAWLVQAHVQYGELTIASTGASYPTLAGNMAAVLTGLLLSFCISIVKPDSFDFAITRTINSASPVSTPNSEPSVESSDDKEKHPEDQEPTIDELPTQRAEDQEMMEDAEVLRDPKGLQRTFYLALILSCTLSFIMDFLIPMPMFFSHYVFSKGFFLGWVVIGFLWVFFAVFTCGILPIAETWQFWKMLYGEVIGGKRKSRA